MKEYLVKSVDGAYWLANNELSLVGVRYEDVIEVPEGTEVVRKNYSGSLNFYKKIDGRWAIKNPVDMKNWYLPETHSGRFDADDGSLPIVWQREKESITDKLVDLPEFKHGVDATLAERQKQYGCFEDVAHVTQGMIALMRQCGYDSMPAPHQMALSMIASKMARLVNGDCNHKDSWHDIGGYAKLIENLIGDEIPF